MTEKSFFVIIVHMNSFNTKIFGGTLALSSLLLALCLLVFMLIPSSAEKQQPEKEIPDFNMLNSIDFTEEYLQKPALKLNMQTTIHQKTMRGWLFTASHSHGLQLSGSTLM